MVSPPPPHSVPAAFDVALPDRAGLAAALRALGRPVAGAVVTISVGASLFDGRFGLTRPRLLAPMPEFPNDVLDPAWCHGDLLVQVAAADPGRAKGALRVPPPGLRPRWRIEGFHPHDRGAGARNLFGFGEGSVIRTPRTRR
ncbi:MAG TPA: Dyp-type peroxidase domain-containing protein [Pilimelia sp.]|nr:Dyp-type peroxidase domain-containing protein [Pilimelia sp.]